MRREKGGGRFCSLFGGVLGGFVRTLRLNSGGRRKVEERERVGGVVDSRGFAKRDEERLGVGSE